MNIIKSTLFLLLALVIYSCSPDQSSTSDIPLLLDRPIQLAGVEWDKIQNTYQTAKKDLQKNANDTDASLKMAEVFMHEARVTGEHGHYYPSALNVLNNALGYEDIKKDGKFNALLYKASVLLSQHDFAEAKKLAQEAMSMNPYNAQLYGTLVDAHLELGEYDMAVKMGDKMVSVRPDIRSYSRISYLREVHGDLDGAIEAMSMAAESGYPGLEQTAWAKLTLGGLYEKKGEPEVAAKIYKSILQERENYPFAIAALGKLELEDENFDQAEQLLLKAANIIPEVGYYIDLAHVYKATDQNEKFTKTTDEVLVMLQDDVDSGHNMNLEYADFYLNVRSDLDKAKEYAEREYNKRPKNMDVNKMMAEILIARGEKAEAQSYLNEALSVNKNSKELNGLKSQLSMKM